MNDTMVEDTGDARRDVAERRGRHGSRADSWRQLLADDAWLDELIDRADEGGVSLTGPGGFLPEMVKAVLERGLAASWTGVGRRGLGHPCHRPPRRRPAHRLSRRKGLSLPNLQLTLHRDLLAIVGSTGPGSRPDRQPTSTCERGPGPTTGHLHTV